MELIRLNIEPQSLAEGFGRVIANQMAESAGVAVDLAQFDALATISVTSDEKYLTAGEGLVRLRSYRKAREAWWAGIIEPWGKVHKHLTGMRGEDTKPLLAIEGHIGDELAKWTRAKEAEARAALAIAQEEQRKAALEAMPWEDVVTAEIVTAPAATPPSVIGLQSRKTPWKGRITDYKVFLRWCLESDERISTYLYDKDGPMVNNKALTLKAGQLTTVMAETIPGTEAYQGTTFAAA